MRRILVMILILTAAPAAARADGRDGQLPPFDPSRAVLSPDGKMWCDPNWCVFSPDAAPELYQGGCEALCGMPRLSDAEDPDVRDWNLIQQLAGKGELASWFVEGGIFRDQPRLMFGPAFASCPPGHPLCSIPTAGDGGSNGGGGGGGRGGGGGSADSCPAPEVVRAPPQIEPLIASPPYPVVAGQDPERKGVIYELTVRVPPVVYRRWEREPDRCEPVPDADGDGKPDRGGNCRTTIGDPPAAWPGDLKPGGCRLIEETYPDPIAGDGLLTMVLSPSSRAWIQGELAAKYPGARVRMPEIRMPIHGQGQVMGDKTFLFTAKVNPKPVDPGVYEVEFFFRTAGTPVSDPIVVRRRIEQKVWLMESAITR